MLSSRDGEFIIFNETFRCCLHNTSVTQYPESRDGESQLSSRDGESQQVTSHRMPRLIKLALDLYSLL